MADGFAAAFTGGGGDRRGAVEAGEAGLGEAADVAGLDEDLGGGAGAMPTRSVSVDFVLATSAASSAAATLSCSRTSRSIETRWSISFSRSSTVGSVTWWCQLGEGVHSGADGLHRRELAAELFGEVVDEGVELAEGWTRILVIDLRALCHKAIWSRLASGAAGRRA